MVKKRTMLLALARIKLKSGIVCVGSMKATQSVACGERIQVLVEDEDGDVIWAAARVARMDADGRFTVEVTEWEESDGASYEDGPFRMNDEGTVWRRIIP